VRSEGYLLDLYCDAENEEHEFNEFPHQFFHEFGATCRANARKSGWHLSKDGEHDLCPKCSGKLKLEGKS
jgi:hypothetical protein